MFLSILLYSLQFCQMVELKDVWFELIKTMDKLDPDSKILKSNDIFTCGLACIESECRGLAYDDTNKMCSVYQSADNRNGSLSDGKGMWKYWTARGGHKDKPSEKKWTMCSKKMADASKTDHTSMVEKLIKNGETIDCSCYYVRSHQTPIMTAAWYGREKMFEFLLKQPADISNIDNDKNNLLHHAGHGGSVTIIKRLIGLGFKVDEKGCLGRTPLLYAAEMHRYDAVEYLVSIGCNTGAVTDVMKENMLHKAMGGGVDRKMVDLVVKLNLTSQLFESRTNSGGTPLMLAVAYRASADAVKYLVDLGMNVTATDNKGHTLLHMACFKHEVDTIKYLVSLKVLDLDSKDSNGKTPLMFAKQMKNKVIVEYLERLNRPT